MVWYKKLKSIDYQLWNPSIVLDNSKSDVEGHKNLVFQYNFLNFFWKNLSLEILHLTNHWPYFFWLSSNVFQCFAGFYFLSKTISTQKKIVEKVPKKEPKARSWIRKSLRKKGKIKGNKQDKIQNKTNRRYEQEREPKGRSDEKQESLLCVPTFLSFWKWFFNELLLYTTKIFYKRRDAKREREKKRIKTNFSDHTRNFHTEYSFHLRSCL